MAITGAKFKEDDDPPWLLSIQAFGWSEGDAVEFLRKRERLIRTGHGCRCAARCFLAV